MAEIHPFKATMYSPSKVGDVSEVISPPYDVISPQEQDELYARHPYNFVRLDLGKELETDNERDNRYTRAGHLYGEWKRAGVLVPDSEPALYIYEQTFRVGREVKTRRAIVGLVRLEDYGSGAILPHEKTHPGPKKDRFKLMQETKAVFSLVFSVFEEEGGLLDSLGNLCETRPFLAVNEPTSSRGMLRRITDVDAIRWVQEELIDKTLYIADGHHRYETSLAFQQHVTEQGIDLPGAAFIPMACVSMADPGLVILPTHRVVQLPTGLEWSTFESNLATYYNLQECRDLAEIRSLLGEPASGPRFGMYSQRTGFYLLEAKGSINIRPGLLDEDNRTWETLDVGILHGHVFGQCMGMPREELFGKEMIEYLHDEEKCVELVRDDEHCVGFFLGAPKLEDLGRVARKGERMPPKSTYFFPKLSSGLIVYDMEALGLA